MGKIKDMQERQTNMNIKNLKEQRYKKEELETKGLRNLKNIPKLLAPNAYKKYKLSKEQRNQQIVGRTIAAIALAFGIGATVGAGISHAVSSPTSNMETQIELQKEDVLAEAENQLLDYVLGEDRDHTDEYVRYFFEKNDGTRILQVVSGDNIVYSYSTTFSLDRFQNASEISSLISEMMDVNFSDNPSQKKLQSLNDALLNLVGKNFKLEGKNIVVDKEQEIDERY